METHLRKRTVNTNTYAPTFTRQIYLIFATLCIFFAPVQLSVGAVQDLGSQKPVVSKRNFHGCLENLLYNGLNLIELAKHKDHQVTVVVS